GRSVRLAATQPGSREGDGGRPRDRSQHHGRGRGQVDDHQPRVGARSREQDRVARDGQGRRRGAVVRRPVQRVHAHREGLGRRRAALRSERSAGAVAQRLRVGLRTGRDDGGRAPAMTIRTRFLAAALCAAAAFVPNGASAQTIAITGGKVYPVSGPPIENGTVLIKDGKIVAVGASVTVPSDAEKVDASGKWVTPG